MKTPTRRPLSYSLRCSQSGVDEAVSSTPDIEADAPIAAMTAEKQRARPLRARGPVDRVWMLALVQRLLLREMRLRKLSLRKAARTSGLPLGTLSYLIDQSRVSDPNKWPKRPLRRGTLLELRGIPWLGPMSVRAIDRLLELTGRARDP